MSLDRAGVPLSQSLGHGTVGQSGISRDGSRDSIGTPDLKALARLILERDGKWDRCGTVAKTAVPRPHLAWDSVSVPLPAFVARFADLDPDQPRQDFSPRRWRDTLRDGSLFLASWATQAHELGWRALDLFGAHRIAPEARWDCAGLVLLIGGGRVVAMTEAAQPSSVRADRGSPIRGCRRIPRQ